MTRTNNYDLPENVRLIAELIGRTRALYLAGRMLKSDGVRHYGRASCLYVPKRLPPGHKLIDLVGEHEAQLLVQAFGGETLKVQPCAAVLRRWRNSETERMAAAGVPRQEIANILGMSDRNVRYILTLSQSA